MKNSKRTLAKKVTSFVLYLDQVPQIQVIVDAIGAEKDAQVLREFIDEALTALRRKTAQQLTLPDASSTESERIKEDLGTIQTLLLKLIEQGEKDRHVRGIAFELLQEILAEAYAARDNSWELLTCTDPNLD